MGKFSADTRACWSDLLKPEHQCADTLGTSTHSPQHISLDKYWELQWQMLILLLACELCTQLSRCHSLSYCSDLPSSSVL